MYKSRTNRHFHKRFCLFLNFKSTGFTFFYHLLNTMIAAEFNNIFYAPQQSQADMLAYSQQLICQCYQLLVGKTIQSCEIIENLTPIQTLYRFIKIFTKELKNRIPSQKQYLQLQQQTQRLESSIRKHIKDKYHMQQHISTLQDTINQISTSIIYKQTKFIRELKKVHKREDLLLREKMNLLRNNEILTKLIQKKQVFQGKSQLLNRQNILNSKNVNPIYGDQSVPSQDNIEQTNSVNYNEIKRLLVPNMNISVLENPQYLNQDQQLYPESIRTKLKKRKCTDEETIKAKDIKFKKVFKKDQSSTFLNSNQVKYKNEVNTKNMGISYPVVKKVKIQC